MSENQASRFLADFEDWVNQQIQVNDMALEVTKQVQAEGGHMARDTAEALIRYEAKLDAYRFLQTKFDNYRAGRDFHDLPDNLINERRYE